MKAIAVFHDKKVVGLKERNPKIGANPPMTLDGMENILRLVPVIRELVPSGSAYCSRLARAADAMSVLAIELDIDFTSMKELGQHGNLDSDGSVIPYPGFEADSYESWQQDGLRAIAKIWAWHEDTETILVVSHRPIIGGLVAHVRGITDNAGIQTVVCDPATVGKGFRVFNYDGSKLTLEV